jgi:UV DNA damage endonuclease
MIIRFGFVAMAMSLKNASPSQTMTVSTFEKIIDREAALRKITRIASSNLMNSLRILRHAVASGVHVYRFSSKLLPLYGHELTAVWDYFRYLAKDLEEVGKFVKKNKIRVSFHPDHYTLLNSPSQNIVARSIEDLIRHVQLFEAMGLDPQAKLVIHAGGGYQDKQRSLQRFIANWSLVPDQVRERMTLENDDRTFTAKETVQLCETVGIPMVLDIHHHKCNPAGTELRDLAEPIFNTWQETGLQPKVHISSPKSETDCRSHHELINADDLLPFLDISRELNQDLDVMIEAKNKDEALFQLVKDLAKRPGFVQIDGGSFRYRP